MSTTPSHKTPGLSEAASKTRTGRPPVFGDAYLAALAGLHPDVKSARGLTDLAYRNHAMSALWKDDRCAWLASKTAMRAGLPNSWRPGILTELGRYAHAFGDDAMLAIALQLCEMKPKTKDAVVMLRRARFRSEAKPANAFDLQNVLARSLDKYTAVHSGVTTDMLTAVLQDILTIYASFDE